MTADKGRGVVRIFRASEMHSIDRGNGINSIPLAGADTGSERLLTGMTILGPGGEIPLHFHSSEECIVVLEGRAAVDVNGERHELTVWDSTYVAAGVPHRFVNLGAVPMRILWIYSATDTTRTFVATGMTSGHLDPYDEKS